LSQIVINIYNFIINKNFTNIKETPYPAIEMTAAKFFGSVVADEVTKNAPNDLPRAINLN
jgi:hypothetical protein